MASVWRHRLFWPVVILVIGVAIVYRSARARR